VQPPQKKTPTEREATDGSLLVERRKRDHGVEERLESTRDQADHLVNRARQHADAVTSTARERADAKHAVCDDVVRERALEDDVVRDERAVADDILLRERIAQDRLLAALLPLERENTDRYLLSERARSDDALARRDEFLGIVAHDLRNLLSGIVLNANVLGVVAREHEGADRTVAGTQRILRYAARMNRLIGDLVDVVSIDAGKLSMFHQLDDATALLVEAADAFRPGAAEKGIALDVDVDERPLMASFDHDRLMQVLANLITNSIKFTPRGGRISVHGARDGSDLRICVSDTGCGIEGRLLNAVFERFWQRGDQDRRGLGLGLYISKCIVEAHGGRIWAESTEGEGSNFHFAIPVSQALP
jgi:signal transduction histidine kinase